MQYKPLNESTKEGIWLQTLSDKLVKPLSIPEPNWTILENARHLLRARYILTYNFGENVLDVGVGTGHLAAIIKKNKPDIKNYTAIDISPNFLKSCSELMIENGIENVTLLNMSGDNLLFPDNSFDTVICTEMLEHVYNPSSIITEMHRVLKQNSICIFSVPKFGVMPPSLVKGHVQDFTISGFIGLIESGGFQCIQHITLYPWEFYLSMKK